MSTMSVSVHLRLLDKLTGPAKKAAKAIRDIGSSSRKMSGATNSSAKSLGRFASAADRAGRRLAKLRREQIAFNRSQRVSGAGEMRRGLSRMNLVAGAGGGFMARGLIGELFSFSDIMNEIDANLGTDADRSMRPLIEKRVTAAAMTSKFTSVEVGKMALELARMGNSSQKIIDKLPTVTNFATATGGSTAEAADVLTNLAKITGKSLTETADLFTATFTSSPQTFHDMAEGLKYSTLLLKKYNIPLEELMASSQILAEQKVKGAMTGTATARMLNAILKPSGPVAKALKKVGIDRDNFLNDEGKLKGGLTQFFKVFEDAEKAMRKKGIKDAGKRMVTAMTLMFKERGSLAFQPLYENYKEFKRRLEALQPHNVSERTSKAALERMKGVAGAIFVIKAAWSALIQDIGKSGLNDDIVSIKDFLKGWLEWFSDLDPWIKRLTGQAILLGSAFAMLVVPLAILTASLKVIGVGALIGMFAMWATKVLSLALRMNTARRAVHLLGLALKTLRKLLRGAFIIGSLMGFYHRLDEIKAKIKELKAEWNKDDGNWGQALIALIREIRNAAVGGVMDLFGIENSYEKVERFFQWFQGKLTEIHNWIATSNVGNLFGMTTRVNPYSAQNLLNGVDDYIKDNSGQSTTSVPSVPLPTHNVRKKTGVVLPSRNPVRQPQVSSPFAGSHEFVSARQQITTAGNNAASKVEAGGSQIGNSCKIVAGGVVAEGQSLIAALRNLSAQASSVSISSGSRRSLNNQVNSAIGETGAATQ